MVFPRPAQGRGGAAAKPTRATATVTVTPASGTAVSGVLLELNDFTVTLRDCVGRDADVRADAAALKVEKNDPLAAHREMLDTLTDKQHPRPRRVSGDTEVKRLLFVCLAAASARS